MKGKQFALTSSFILHPSSFLSNADSDLERRVEDARGELAQGCEHPAREDDEHDDGRDYLRHEGERLLLHLRERLQEAYDEPDHEARQERRQRQEQYEPERLARERHESLHCVPLLTLPRRRQVYPSTRLRIRISQPSTNTKSSSLNGSDIIVGESMNMPIA